VAFNDPFDLVELGDQLALQPLEPRCVDHSLRLGAHIAGRLECYGCADEKRIFVMRHGAVILRDSNLGQTERSLAIQSRLHSIAGAQSGLTNCTHGQEAQTAFDRR